MEIMPMVLNKKGGGSSATELIFAMKVVVLFCLFSFNVDVGIGHLTWNRMSFV